VILLAIIRTLTGIWILSELLLTRSLAGLLLLCAAGLLLVGSSVRWIFLLLIPKADNVECAPAFRVAVVTTFVPGFESLTMLERTLRAMSRISYPHETWVLDEGNEEAVLRLSERLGVRHFSRRNRPEYQAQDGVYQRGTKHGNYNSWLAETGFASYDVLAAIDPDQVPRMPFLTETLGHFRDPGIAYVQCPQHYYNQSASIIARGSDEEGRDFYWLTQRVYHRFGSPSVIGAHGVHRIEALKTVGGFAPHVADDLLLTLLYQRAGWRGAYVPYVLAAGLAPVDWGTYLKQQRRWARSLLDVKLRVFPQLLENLPIHSRIAGLMQGLSYFQDSAVGLCLLIAACVQLAFGFPQPVLLLLTDAVALTAVGFLIITGLYPHICHGTEKNLSIYWRAGLLRCIKWPYTLLGLVDVIQRRDRGYDLTSKVSRPTSVQWMMFWPHLLICAAVATCWIAGTVSGNARGLVPNVVATVALIPSLTLIGSILVNPPPPYDPSLADAEQPTAQ
jgi:hypothetical protein